MQPILLIFDIFHFDISGNDINDLHLKNKPLKSLELLIFHSEISGNEINELHPEKKPLILLK